MKIDAIESEYKVTYKVLIDKLINTICTGIIDTHGHRQVTLTDYSRRTNTQYTCTHAN